LQNIFLLTVSKEYSYFTLSQPSPLKGEELITIPSPLKGEELITIPSPSRERVLKNRPSLEGRG